MKITKHGQSCFTVEIAGSMVGIDVGIFVFNDEGLTPEDFAGVKLLIFTHIHSDHFDWPNVRTIIKNNSPIVLGTAEVIKTIKEEFPNLDARAISAGEKYQFDNFTVEAYSSKHGPLPNGKNPPEVSGIVIDDGRNRFYTPGDSIFLDEKSNASVIAVPICGQVVMNIEQAKQQVIKLNPRLTIPIHYDNQKYPVDVKNFEKAMGDTHIEVKILSWGESINIS